MPAEKPIRIACPMCQAMLKAPVEAAGKQVKCKECGHRFQAGVTADQIRAIREPPAADVDLVADIPVAVPAVFQPQSQPAIASDSGRGRRGAPASPHVVRTKFWKGMILAGALMSVAGFLLIAIACGGAMSLSPNSRGTLGDRLCVLAAFVGVIAFGTGCALCVAAKVGQWWETD